MKVRVLPCQPHSLAFGGFEIQMLSAMKATREAGVDIEPLDAWSRDGDFDILQLWGLEDAHFLSIKWGYSSGKKIVLTALLPYLTPKASIRYLTAKILGFKRIQSNILSMVDQLVVVNQEQARTASNLIGFPDDKISIIPNIIEDIYFDNMKIENKTIRFGVEKYIVCTGNVCKRKNQLVLAQAAIQENIPLVIVGKSVSGEESYAEDLKKLIHTSNKVQWIEGLQAHSSEMLSAYQGSVGFALLSTDETQPISALEAAALGKPLILSDSSWARQKYYENALLINPYSLDSVRKGIRQLLDETDKHKIQSENINECNRLNVGEAYAEVYAKLLEIT